MMLQLFVGCAVVEPVTHTSCNDLAFLSRSTADMHSARNVPVSPGKALESYQRACIYNLHQDQVKCGISSFGVDNIS